MVIAAESLAFEEIIQTLAVVRQKGIYAHVHFCEVESGGHLIECRHTGIQLHSSDRTTRNSHSRYAVAFHTAAPIVIAGTFFGGFENSLYHGSLQGLIDLLTEFLFEWDGRV